MDNDKQVTDLVQTTRDRFLDHHIDRDDKDRDAFDLEMEFAKTAKNKSLLVPLAVVVFLLLLALGAWLASQFTEQASQKSTVSIGSFDDLKLKEIFDAARKNKKDLEAVQDQINQLNVASNAKIVVLQQRGASKADIASVNDATGTEAKAILADTNKQIAAEKAALATSLKPLKVQAEEIQKKIDTYDDRIGQMNKKNQQQLDSQQRLFDLQKAKLSDEYEARIRQLNEESSATVNRLNQEREALVSALKAKQAEDIRKLILKYNPVITDVALSAQFTALGTQKAAYPFYNQPDRISSYQLIPADLQTTLAARVEKTHVLLERLRSIPYENSVPPLINVLDNAIADSLSGYEDYLAPLAAHMVQLDGVIAERDATIVARDATIVARDNTIVERDATIVWLNSEIARLDGELLQEKADRKAEVAAAMEARLAAEAAEAADRARELAAERDKAASWLARWTGGIDAFVATLREDGLIVDGRVPDDLLVVIKPERAKALAAAITAAANAPPPVVQPGKTAPVVPPVNLGTIRDGLNGGELGTVLVELGSDGMWRVKLVKQNDPKKPFKSYDRLVLALPLPKK